MLFQLQVMFALVTGTMRQRLAPLREDGERGSGGITLEGLILAVGGVVAAGLIVLAIKAVIDNLSGDLNPDQTPAP